MPFGDGSTGGITSTALEHGAVESRSDSVTAAPDAGPVTRAARATITALAAAALVVGLLTLAAGVPGTRASARSQQEPAPVVHGHELQKRWVYVQTNLQVDDNAASVIGLLDRAHAADYNGAVLADTKLDRLFDDSLLPRYYDNLASVLRHAAGLGMTVLPCTASFGYSSSLLWHNPDLAEGLPVREATFRAESGRLVPFEAEPVQLENADFEALPSSGHTFPGWAWQDKPGETTFVDTQVKHSGRASLRMTDIGITNPPHGNGRIHQRLQVEPFHNYHVSVWVKTEGFRGGDVRLLVMGREPERVLQWNSVPVQATQDWQRFDVTFNSLVHDEILFYFGVWGGGSGTIWWDDGAIEPAGLVNTVRRPGTPVRITSEDSSVTFTEGVDVERLVDPLSGRAPYAGVYDLWHEPPEIRLVPGSRIREGDVVLVSHYHMATIYGFQVTASLTEPESLAIVERQMASQRDAFAASGAFDGWMFLHDEIRVHGWDQAPLPGAGTPGESLAYNFRTLRERAAALDRSAPVYVWSDMFDPFHNAVAMDSPYYLVNGDWRGSWEGVAPDVTIVNWNHDTARRRSSAEFFANRGNRQILAGYYDAEPGQFGDRQWLADLEGVPGVEGVMYTQWYNGYDDLEAWAEHVWGRNRTATATASPTYVATASAPTQAATASSPTHVATASSPTDDATAPSPTSDGPPPSTTWTPPATLPSVFVPWSVR